MSNQQKAIQLHEWLDKWAPRTFAWRTATTRKPVGRFQEDYVLSFVHIATGRQVDDLHVYGASKQISFQTCEQQYGTFSSESFSSKIPVLNGWALLTRFSSVLNALVLVLLRPPPFGRVPIYDCNSRPTESPCLPAFWICCGSSPIKQPLFPAGIFWYG